MRRVISKRATKNLYTLMFKLEAIIKVLVYFKIFFKTKIMQLADTCVLQFYGKIVNELIEDVTQ